jgi:hypothetical protein
MSKVMILQTETCIVTVVVVDMVVVMVIITNLSHIEKRLQKHSGLFHRYICTRLFACAPESTSSYRDVDRILIWHPLSVPHCELQEQATLSYSTLTIGEIVPRGGKYQH